MKLDDAALREMVKRHEYGIVYESKARDEFDKDMAMFLGEGQWEESLRQKRRKTGRPCLTINLLPEKVQSIVNNTKMNKPAGKVSPVENSDQDTAEVMQGIGRHVEYMNRGQLAYNTAYEHATVGGFGYWRYNTQYVDVDTVDQELIIEPIFDALAVICDPDAKFPDGSDAKWWFIVDQIRRDEFKRLYPKADLVVSGFTTSLIQKAKAWFSGDYVQIAEYWEDTITTVHKIAVPDPTKQRGYTLVPENEIPKGVEALRSPKTGQVIERDVDEHKWSCHKTNGVEDLEVQKWAGRYAPIVRTTGKRLIHKGKVYYISSIRNSRDPQIMVNYAESSATEATMLSTKAPWIGWKGQFKDARWKDAHLTNYTYLELEPAYGKNGEILPPPQRNIYEPPIQALSMIAMRAAEYVKSTTGIYNSSLGNGEVQRSGKAESMLQRAGDLSNYHLFDNLVQSIWQGWRIMLDMIPRIYDTERMVRILGNDERQKIVKVNGEFQDPKTGQAKTYDLGAGKYDVTVDVGPAYNTMRQEAAANMNSFATAVPELVPRWADLYVKAQDWPMKDEIAKRIVPPEFAQEDGQENPVPPQVQEQMQKMGQTIDALTQHLNAAQDELDLKKAELESKKQMNDDNNQTKLIVEWIKSGSQEAINQMREELAALRHEKELTHQKETLQSQQDFQASQSAQNNNGSQPGAAGVE